MPDRTDPLSWDERHRAAARPRARGLWPLTVRVFDRLNANHLSMLAAGVGFYAFLSLFPGLVALVALYGLVAEPAVVERHLDAFGTILPPAVQTLLDAQLKAIVEHSGRSLSYALVLSLGFALWSAASALKALMEALNIAYGEVDRRGLIRFNLEALALTLGAMLVMTVLLVAVVVVPIVIEFLDWLGLPDEIGTLLAFARWPILAASILFALAVLYRFVPSRARPRWRWLSAGAVLATALWLLGSAAFSYYVSHFSSFDRIYGSLSAVVVLMLWLELSAFLVILGGQVNAELEPRDDETG